jgi:hypothetical protein
VDYVHAQGNQRPRRAIELSETNSAEILTNLDLLTTPKEGIKQLEDQLKSLRGISPVNSMEERFGAPYVSPTMSVLPNKTMKELLDRQKNWNLTPEELGTATISYDSDSFSTFGDDKKDSKKLSSLQQFYDTLNRRSATRDNTDKLIDTLKVNSSKSSDARDDTVPVDDDSKLPPGLRDKAQKLKEMVDEDTTSIFNPTRARSSFENFFGLSESNPNHDSVGGSKNPVESFMDQFKKTLDMQSSGVAMDPSLKSLVSDGGVRLPTYPGLDSSLPTGTKHDLTESTPGNLNSILNRTAMPDVNSTLLNQWNPMYSPPPLDLPKRAPSMPMTMDIPRRHF